MRIHAVKDVDHAATGRFARGPETFVVMKVEDNFKGRTKSTRTDKWTDELHNIDIDKANEIELTVYDKSGDHPTPIGMLWIRIADIAEEMRRKKIETEFNNSGWVSAAKMDGDGAGGRQETGFGGSMYPDRSSKGAPGGPPMQGVNPNPVPSQSNQIAIDSWFALEPVGQIHLTMSFGKS